MTAPRTLFHIFNREPLALDCGRALSPYTLAYQTWGELNAARANAILVYHPLSLDAHLSGRHEDGRTGWWDGMVGPGRALDTDRYFVVCANVLGSCKGSTGPGSSSIELAGRPYGATFPVLTLPDLARAQLSLLRELGLERLHAVVGASMGGMLALATLQLAPALTERTIVLAAAAANPPQAIAWNHIGREAILADPAWQGGAYYDSPLGPPRRGLGLARMIGHVTYVSEGALERKFGRRLQAAAQPSFSFGVDYAIESYLNYQGQVFHERFDANSYLYLTRAIDYFDFAAATGGDLVAAFAAAPSRYRFLSFSADWLYSPARNEAMAIAARAAGLDARHHEIEAPLGHDAFLVQMEPQSRLLREFLES